MEFSKQEIKLFLPLPGLWSKNFFCKMFLIWSKGFKINIQNRKYTYLDQSLPTFTYRVTQKKRKNSPLSQELL